MINEFAVTESNPESREMPGWLVALALTLIILVGAVWRFAGMNWDENQHLHPDERFLTMVESALNLPGMGVGAPPPGCAKWSRYFDTACSPLNPYNRNYNYFVYGTFPIFIVRAVGEYLEMVGYDQIHLVGRMLSALFDLMCVPLIFFIGRRLYGERAGLLGAFFLAGAVLNIQQSHFFTVDTFSNVPILLAFWGALDIAERKHWRAFIFAGAFFGLALAGRINLAFFAIVLIAAAGLRAWRAFTASRDDSPETLTPDARSSNLAPFAYAILGLIVTAFVAIIVFRIAQPYAAKGPDFISPTIPELDLDRGIVTFGFDAMLAWAGGVNLKFAENMASISELMSGRVDMPPGHQWTNRTAYIFPLTNIVLWGLGLPLGIAAWLGFAFALYQLLRYQRWEHLLIVLWVGVTFGYTGQQYVKTMRYFLQIYPFLALLAGFLIVATWDYISRFRASRFTYYTLRSIAAILALVTIGYTAFYATAFTTIYTREVSRVAASRWILKNIPAGATISSEHWDDALPLRVDGKDPFGGIYRGVEMQWYGEDIPEKIPQAIQWLDQTDYIVLSSNRLYESIPRLPMRYPLTTKYYEWLFDGTLGFDLLATFTSRPQLFGIEIVDDNAEEAFTVYDHPKVLIFKKTPRYSREHTATLFNGVDLTEVYRFSPVVATQAPTALLLKPDDWNAQIAGGTWSEIFNPNDLANQIPVIVWLVMIEILGWLAFPIAFVAFRALADRGYIFAKALGILLPAWGVWLLASYHVAQFNRASILLVIALVAIANALIAWRHARELRAFLREQRAVILVEEIAFLVFFGAFLFIRYGNPDLWHQWYGGEKPMDVALLNAITKSTYFPPYDPWFAGGYINYYYFGQLITATLVRLSGIVPEVSYNLALPMFFALTALGAFSVAFNLVAKFPLFPLFPSAPSDSVEGNNRNKGNKGKIIVGLLAAFFVAVIGNLGQLILLILNFARIGGGDPKSPAFVFLTDAIVGALQVVFDGKPFDVATGHWYWNASRIIPETINEFPFFSFLYADLHAHVMALPFTLLTLGIAANFLLRTRDSARALWLDAFEVFIAGLTLGALRAINFADYPTYALVLVCALAMGEYARRQTIDLAGLIAVAWRIGAIIALSSALFQPFVSQFASAYLATELWKGAHTSLGEYLVVHGIFLFVIVTFLIATTFDTKNSRGALRLARLLWLKRARLDRMLNLQRALSSRIALSDDLTAVGIGVVIVFVAILVLAQLPVFALVFVLLALAANLILRPGLDPARRFIALLIAAGLAMTLMVEVITYKGDIGRMNTVFKFYLQVWVFFAIASAVGIAHIAVRLKRHATMQPLWWTLFGILVFIGLLYPITATNAKVNDRYSAGLPSGLNGLDYLKTAVYAENRPLNLGADRDAILWMRENIAGSPVILEGNSGEYRWGTRVAINTGLPTVIGWNWHQKQQRSIIDGGIVDRRMDTVRAIYNTREPGDALAMLRRYRVAYIYIGDLERNFYDAQGLAKFDAMTKQGLLDLAYENSNVKIYKIK